MTRRGGIPHSSSSGSTARKGRVKRKEKKDEPAARTLLQQTLLLGEEVPLQFQQLQHVVLQADTALDERERGL
jgi:hypothetical protein